MSYAVLMVGPLIIMVSHQILIYFFSNYVEKDLSGAKFTCRLDVKSRNNKTMAHSHNNVWTLLEYFSTEILWKINIICRPTIDNRINYAAKGPTIKPSHSVHYES